MKTSLTTISKQAGDTIVEVLIAIAVASSVLGIVFATSSRNLRATQTIQERSEATRLIQGQIEALRYINLTDSSKIPFAGTPFCMKDGAINPISFSSLFSATGSLTFYSTDCINGFYHYVIIKQLSGTFKLNVRWESLTSASEAQVTMVYRVD